MNRVAQTMGVVPALLADKIADFMVRLRQAEGFAQYAQVDMMDGLFVPTTSISIGELNSFHTALLFEVHLMVVDPLPYVTGITNPGLRRIVFHYESAVDPEACMRLIQQRGIGCGIAVKPETPLTELSALAEKADTLLFLAVDPGRYGSPFKPEVLQKVTLARKMYPGKKIAVDGGVSLENLESIWRTGADYVVVGSRIFLSNDPAINYRAFVRRVRELERGASATRPT